MIKAVKEFSKSYMELVKVSVKWFAKHWKGYLLISTVIGVICGLIAWFNMKKFEKDLNDILTDDYKGNFKGRYYNSYSEYMKNTE